MRTQAPGFVQVLIKVIDRVGQVLQLLVQGTQVLDTLLLLLHCSLLSLNAFEQFIQVYGFLVVVGKAFAQGSDHILLVGLAGEHDGFENSLMASDNFQRLE
ncbi:hypothetical protein D3C71_1800820 [compost metagenome]